MTGHLVAVRGITVLAYTKDSIGKGCPSDAASIVNVHQDHGRVTRRNQVLVIVVFSLTTMLVIALLRGYSNKTCEINCYLTILLQESLRINYN